MKRFLLALPLLLCLWPTSSSSEAWSVAREGSATVTGAISDSTQAAQIDDHITADRQEIRYREEVEHCFGPNTQGCYASGGGGSQTEDHGRHREGSARAFMQSSAPTGLVRADYDNTARASGDGVTDLDDGRLFVDSDTNQLQVYDESAAAWENVSVGSLVGGGDILQGSFNLLYNGSFENTDGDGVVTATTGTPAGWTNSGTPGTYTYTARAAASSEALGTGINLNLTAVANNDAITQTLTGLRASTVYKVIAEAKDDGTGTCSVTTSGASSEASATTTTDVWETLQDTFTTDATGTAVVVALESDNAGQVCNFDNAAVYEQRDNTATRHELTDSGVVRYRTTSTATTGCSASWTGTCDNVLTLVVTPPGPGYIIQLTGKIHISLTPESVLCSMRLYDGSNTLDQSTFGNGGSGTNVTNVPLTVRATVVAPTPGTSTTYTIDVYEGAGATCALARTSVGGVTPSHYLEAVLIPVR